MSDVAVTWAKAQPCPNRIAKQVLVHMASYADAEGEVWALVPILALEMEVVDRSVQRGIQALLAPACGLLEATGRWHVHKGKRVPLYRMPLEKGHANTLRRLRAEANSGVTRVSPQAARKAVLDVTPTGDNENALGVTSRTALLKDSTKGKRKLSTRARAVEETPAFEAALAAWPVDGLDSTDVDKARIAFDDAAAKAGDPWRIVGAAQAYVAARAGQKRDFPPPALHNWLRRESWRGRLPAEGWRPGAPLTATPATNAVRGAFPDPALRQALVEGLGEGTGAALDRCVWDADRRTLIAPVYGTAQRLHRLIGGRMAAVNIEQIEWAGGDYPAGAEPFRARAGKGT